MVEFSEEGIPKGADRTLCSILNARKGLCYDRSWIIEKILTAYGFRTRHVFVLENKNNSFFRTITSLSARSHALTEVETARGWLIVDSIDQWVSLDDSENPVDFSKLVEKNQSIKGIPKFLKQEHFYVYGLYSRSGMMFQPLLPIPDVNWEDFVDNKNHFHRIYTGF